MKYIAVRFKIDGVADELMQTAADLLTDAACTAGFESFETEGHEVTGYVQKDLYDVQALEAELSQIPLVGISVTYTASDVADTNWNATWEEAGFEPINIGGECIVYDARHTSTGTVDDYARNTGMTIGIEARQAFGTGTHQTTRMVIAEMLARKADVAGSKVLDCGCGTGILGIAAMKMGAKNVVGYDIDEWSVENAQHNMALNGITDGVRILHGDASVLENIDERFDIVAANINRNILLADMERMRGMMKNRSWIIISGFYINDIPLLLEKATALKLREDGRRTDDEWACLVLTMAQ